MKIAWSKAGEELATAAGNALSSTAVAIVGANLIPLVGALLLGWNLGTMVLLYWLECAVVGFINVPKLALAQGWAPTKDFSTVEWLIIKIVAIPGFVIYFGVFLIASGSGAMYLAVADGGTIPPSEGTSDEVVRAMFAALDVPVAEFTIAAIVLVLSQLVSFNGFLLRRDYEQTTVREQFWDPHPRVFMLLGATLASGFVMDAFDNPVWAIAGFVIGKTLLEIPLAGRIGHGSATFGDGQPALMNHRLRDVGRI
jgi:hypothetical protein